MKHGFLRVAAATPRVVVADCTENAAQIMSLIDRAISVKAEFLVFPELCITGYTCGDLFLQDTLLSAARKALTEIVYHTKGSKMPVIVGMPLQVNYRLYNTAVVICNGHILGIVPKTHIPNYSEFYEARHFSEAPDENMTIKSSKVMIGPEKDYDILFGTKILFEAENFENFIFAAEICEDIWTGVSPSLAATANGAVIIANLSASDEITGKADYRRDMIRMASGRMVCGYIYADAGEGESSTDLVFAGHDLICENGLLLSESKRFTTGLIYTEIDTGRLANERRRMMSFKVSDDGFARVSFEAEIYNIFNPVRKIDNSPFVPYDTGERDKRCSEITSIQAAGLRKRLKAAGIKTAVVGISGGLDSTLALLITVKAFKQAGLATDGIISVTMPCFGTTDRTYNNAVKLSRKLGTTLKEINIRETVTMHFKDIGHDENIHDVTYENAQARERTRILMDLANEYSGLVIGTGDMSELALGWATYNGDHMSMYGVNASVPKTLVRYLVRYFADTAEDKELKEVLYDILETPVSPELLPPKDGVISQRTEDLVGPYMLHDFFIYNVLRYGFEPEKIFDMAHIAFEGFYSDETIIKWMKVFYRRFFSQQFKRSCLPDGPKVGSVSVSPRGDLRMPSDASAKEWLKKIEGQF